MTERIESYADFFPYYLREHSRSGTRALHYLAAVASLACLLYGLVIGPWWIALLMPVAGYGPAWIAHGFIEHNKPATFTYPFWSLISDYYMTALWATGQLRPHLERAGVSISRDEQPGRSDHS